MSHAPLHVVIKIEVKFINADDERDFVGRNSLARVEGRLQDVMNEVAPKIKAALEGGMIPAIRVEL